MRRALCAALFFLVGFTPALGEVRIEASTGGEVSHYLELFAVLRQSRERIVIDGPCYSACTLVLSTIPHNRVCVTRRAILGFHAPRLVDDYGREYLAPEATREVVAAYPAPIRNWISRHGGLRQRPIFLRTSPAPPFQVGASIKLPIALAVQPAPFPRLRALALFGRRSA